MNIFKTKYDESYFTKMKIPFIRRTKTIAKLVKSFKKHGDLLEIGCGDGLLLDELKTDFNVEGIDISEAAINIAQKLIDKRKLKLMNIEKENMNRKYDIILAFNVLEHLRNPKKTITKIKGALKSGGIFIFSVPNNYGIFGTLATEILNYFDKTHISTLRREEWINISNELNFKIRKIINITPFGLSKLNAAKYFASSFIIVLQIK